MIDAYRKDIDKVFSELKSALPGLKEKEAQERISTHGTNQLTGKKKITAVFILFRQFLNPLVYVLVAAATIKAIVKGPLDALTIFAVLLFMAVVGFIQEFRAGKAMDALLQLSAPKAKVKRDGNVRIIPAKNIVPGDVVILEAGDKVPADGRLFETASLKINESSLTGESLPVEKNIAAIDKDASLGERKNMVYSGTAVVAGRGQFIITAIGMQTEIGKIAAAVQGIKEEKTSLQRSIDNLGHSLIWIILGVCSALVLLGLWKNMAMVDVFMLAVAAAVAAIPEGLPAVVTVVLASGMQRMARHNAIIRKLVAVETLGSTTVICSDKTGTLTLNQMTVQEILVDGKIIEVRGQGYRPEGGFFHDRRNVEVAKGSSLELCLRIGLLCNDASLFAKKETFEIIGDPTEGALVVAAAKAGMKKEVESVHYPRLDEIPFQSERQYMATLHRDGQRKLIFVKGSLERLLPKAKFFIRNSQKQVLNEEFRKEFMNTADAMARKAMRVLTIALAELAPGKEKLTEDDIDGTLTIVGLCGMIDPPREEAKKAIAACHAGGIKVIMATGDNLLTGRAVGSWLGIKGSLSLTGSQLSDMTDETLHAKIEDVSVFARIEPLHKLRIIQAFKSRGAIVAMTGDGVNDAPALEAADIGIAMGITGTDVAKEAADMVLADDNFATIVTAVEEGRAIFNRLRSVVFFLMTTCFGELLALILGIIFLGQASLIPLQILWINLVTGALLAIPLGLEPRVGDELSYPPRSPKVGIIYPGMLLRIGVISSLLGIGAFLVFSWTLRHYEIHEARAMTFCCIVIFEWLVAFNARSDEKTIFKLGFFKNPWLFGAVFVGLSLQLLVIYVPFMHRFFDTVPLKGFEWGIALLPGLLIFIFETMRKIVAPKLYSAGK
ncbi:MAG: HAD-IC family P-type ATPase [Candidatus Omnitrophica bacterium]|nr:HAD-IC family P-type ATPase [Candidatus Omnitrophota bacterium]